MDGGGIRPGQLKKELLIPWYGLIHVTQIRQHIYQNRNDEQGGRKNEQATGYYRNGSGYCTGLAGRVYVKGAGQR